MVAAESSPKSKGRKRSHKAAPPSLESVRAAFVACPRCGFFLTGYGLLHDDLERASANSEDGWLMLTWSGAIRHLLHKSYGCRVDLEAFHFQGVCRDCSRAFLYQAAEVEDQPELFCIQIEPGS